MSAENKKSDASAGDMAWLVGEALRAGGITVHQTKEKFGSIRVYVGIPNNHEARVHYRGVYRAAMAASPELADNLRGSADRSEWLYATEAELDAAIARHVARGGANALDAWSPHFTLARQLIKGEDTSDFLDGDTEIVDAGEVEPPVTLSRDLFEAAHAAIGWACVQGGGGQWLDIHKQMSDALNNTKKG